MLQERAIAPSKLLVEQKIEMKLLSFSQKNEAAQYWRKLEQQIDNQGLTNSWPWIESWLEFYHDVVTPWFAFGWRGDLIVGAALITQATHHVRGIPLPTVYLGTSGEPKHESIYVEYNRLLVFSTDRKAFAEELMQTVKKRFRWSVLECNGFVPEDAEALMQAGERVGLHFTVQEQASPTFNFQLAEQAGHDDVITELGSKTRHFIRYGLRTFESLYGPQKIEWAEDTEHAGEILEELILIHQERWRRVNKPGAFQTERVKQYHRRLIETLGLWPHGSLIVFRLKYGETTIGCLYCYADAGGQVSTYKTGLAHFDDRKLKPSLVAHTICMQECRRRSQIEVQKLRETGCFSEAECQQKLIAHYDFMAGEEEYKRLLSNTSSTLIWATTHRGLRPWLVEQGRQYLPRLRALLSKAKKKIRQEKKNEA